MPKKKLEAAKTKLNLVGLDGNAWNLPSKFSRATKHQGWTKEEIDAVTNEAMAGDYHRLLRTLMKHTTGRGTE